MDSYDYIIVGAGSAGCVLAHRLSANSDVTVLLLEAGDADPVEDIYTPRSWVTLWRTGVDWGYRTEPQPGLNGRRVGWPRGKVIGGSSAINVSIYIRGNRRDFDHWRDLGNPGWDYASVLPYFLRSEGQQHGESRFHGSSGPLTVTDLQVPHPLSKRFVDAAVELGYARNPDFNGVEQLGAGLLQLTVRDGKRCSAATAFLPRGRDRANLCVETGVEVECVQVEGGRAVGVSFAERREKRTAHAEREVILCAGAINSPKLLLLSGIGPADSLRAVGVEPLVDLPGVGQNLQDHLAPWIRYETKSAIPVHATSNDAEACLFAHSSLGTGDRAPELQFFVMPGLGPDKAALGEGGGLQLVTTATRPESRGFLTLRSRDPSHPPLIDPRYLDEPRDLALLVEGIEILRSIAGTTAFADECGNEIIPGVTVRDRSALEDYIRKTASTLWHPVGTCKMGTDALAVVDPEQRVRGVDGLRVADASIMPTLTTGNTNAPAIMIGEKAADLIQGVNLPPT